MYVCMFYEGHSFIKFNMQLLPLNFYDIADGKSYLSTSKFY